MLCVKDVDEERNDIGQRDWMDRGLMLRGRRKGFVRGGPFARGEGARRQPVRAASRCARSQDAAALPAYASNARPTSPRPLAIS